jgi:hypothetical protein
MTSTDFHTLKERHVAAIGSLMVTIGSNPFREETKNDFMRNGASALKVIHDQRKHVYRELENFDFNIDHVSKTPPVEFTVNPKKLRDCHAMIMQKIADIIRESESVTVGSTIVLPANNEKFQVTLDFHDSTVYIVERLNAMSAAIMAEENEVVEEKKEDSKKKEENQDSSNDSENSSADTILHTLTEGDFDLNPDLNKLGFNVGDKIAIDNKALLANNKEEEEVKIDGADKTDAPPTVPSTGTTVVPISEIEQQNKEEKKAPRKRAPKK